MKVLLTDENKIFPYKGKDVHTKWGYVKKDDIEASKVGSVLKTSKGKELFLIEAGFKDYYSKLKRQAQIMLPKDIAAIVANCGVTKKSRVLDAGSGSGGTACMLASIAKNVYSYEKRQDHASVARENAEMLGLTNLKIKEKDIYEGIDEKKLDLVILDVPEPWLAIESAFKALVPGGWVVNYSPNLTQVKKFVQDIEAHDNFLYVKTIELIEREWEVQEKKLRPNYRMLGHTGFLTFARRV